MLVFPAVSPLERNEKDKYYSNDKIKQSVSEKAEKLLEKAARKSSRIIEGEATDISSVFGIEIEEPLARGKRVQPETVTSRKKNKVTVASQNKKLPEKKDAQKIKAKKVKKETTQKTALMKVKTTKATLKKKAAPKKSMKNTVKTIKKKR